MAIKHSKFIVSGMHCAGCETTIEKIVNLLPGILSVKSSFREGLIRVAYDSDLIDIASMKKTLDEHGYTTKEQPMPLRYSARKTALFFFLLLSVGGIALWGKSLMPNLMPQLSTQMSYFMLFTIGVLTGFHCIGMCGSFVVSYVSSSQSYLSSTMSHLMYGTGKTMSYTVLGGMFGLFGAAITITNSMKFTVAILSGIFLILYGIRMLNFFPSLRLLNIKMPEKFTRIVSFNINKSRKPFTIGLLNGLMLGCGPLQAMYILAAGTGSPLEGAQLLFFFSIGTLLPLLSFGMVASYITKKTIAELIRVSGILVMLMGGMMLNRAIEFIA